MIDAPERALLPGLGASAEVVITLPQNRRRHGCANHETPHASSVQAISMIATLVGHYPA